MSWLLDSRPIIACSTGEVQAALSVIRVSGFKNFDFLNSFTGLNSKKIQSRKVYLTQFFAKSGEIFDQGLLTAFFAPSSYTGENMLEFSVHGNPFQVRKIINFLTREYSFRLAERGEFTYRAYRNGKMNLTQVEGLEQLLKARSPLIFKKGLETLYGSLFKIYEKLRKNFLELKASVELSIDFLEDVGVDQAEKQFNQSCENLKNTIDELYFKSNHSGDQLLRPKVILVGPTNSGKSTLFNYFLDESRSIVSDEAGTTRDYVSQNIIINGSEFQLIDTAGLRETINPIEKEGIQRSRRLLDVSFFKILVINPFEWEDKNFNFVQNEKFDAIILTHFDKLKTSPKSLNINVPTAKKIFYYSSIDHKYKPAPIGPELKSCPVENSKNGSIEPFQINEISLNAIFNHDFNMLEDFKTNFFDQIAKSYENQIQNSPILIQRHVQLIEDLYYLFDHFDNLRKDTNDIAILSNELNIISSRIDQLLGFVTPDEVLKHIFSEFCIGK